MSNAKPGMATMDDDLASQRRGYYGELASQLRNLAHKALFAAARRDLIKLARRFDSEDTVPSVVPARTGMSARHDGSARSK